jgi:hypothetical protein
MTSKTPGTDHRVLVVDVKPRRMGFAIIETPARLLDFGIARVHSPHAGMRRVAALIPRFRPAVVVVRKIKRRSRRNQRFMRAVLRLISYDADHSSIKVAAVDERQVKFSLGGNRLTKHEVASLLARAFPELSWKLPQPRKSWQTERWNMLIFDTVALGMAYLASTNDESVINKLEGAKKSLFAGPSVA